MAKSDPILKHSNIVEDSIAAMNSILVTAVSPVTSIVVASHFMLDSDLAVSQKPPPAYPRAPFNAYVEMRSLPHRSTTMLRGSPSQTDATAVDDLVRRGSTVSDETSRGERPSWYYRSWKRPSELDMEQAVNTTPGGTGLRNINPRTRHILLIGSFSVLIMVLIINGIILAVYLTKAYS